MTVHPNRAIFLPRTNLPTFGEFRESPTRPQTRIPDPGTAQVKCFLRIWGGGGGGESRLPNPSARRSRCPRPSAPWLGVCDVCDVTKYTIEGWQRGRLWRGLVTS